MSEQIIPMNYRGYIIDFAPEYTRSKYQFVHEDYDGDEDKRIGVRDDLQQCMLDIDDQVIEWQAGRIESALSFAVQYGGIDGDHHKAWVIDQMVRALAGDDYTDLVAKACAGEDGPDTFDWNVGIAP